MRHATPKRAKELRERKKMIARRWPDGPPPCSFVPCGRRADDVHELLSRARGGSISDDDNCVPLCRAHHSIITLNPTWAEVHGWARRGDVAS